MPAYKMNCAVPCSKTVEEFHDSMQMRERCGNCTRETIISKKRGFLHYSVPVSHFIHNISKIY
jgi:hypothetical protein